MDVKGKVVLVTGSSSGIGAGVARLFAAKGARVVVNSSSSVQAGEALAGELPGAIYVQADIADPVQARRLVDSAVSHYGRLDVLVNNAGTTVRIDHADIDAVTPEVWHRILEVNVVGTWSVIQAAVPALREHGDGCIVNITSVAGVRPTGSSIPYAASKAALNHLTSLLAAALGPHVRVNAVAPGLIDTPWTSTWTELHELTKLMAPLQRVGTPEDVAAACLSLVRTPYVTGHVLLCDGGLHLR
jgi:ketoreductase RED2